MPINLVAPINQLGYGVVGCNVLKALQQANHEVSYFPIGQPSWDSDLSFVKTAIAKAKEFDHSAPSIRIWHQNELAMFPGGGERIGWPIFELNKFTDLEIHHLKSVDRLFVCSEWAKQVCRDNGIESRIDVIPLGVDTSIFCKDDSVAQHRAYWTRNKTVFVNVGKWEVRKGHNELLEAFNKAFTPEDNVELWMINHNPFIGQENEAWKTKYLSSNMGVSVRILPRVNSQRELAAIFNSVDFGVFPAHAEGWNLEPLELMACGVPSIVTNYSGHTEYLNDANSFLVEPDGMESAQDGRWFHGEGEWCTFKVDELVEAMRAAHDYKQSGSEALKDAMAKTVEDFTWSKAVEKIGAVL
jgi:glycosyltransferase involved in cell wall biosynthesis